MCVSLCVPLTLTNPTPPLIYTHMQVRNEKMAAAATKRKTKGYVVKNVLMLLVLAGSVALCFMRAVSVYDNYSGYMKVRVYIYMSVSVSVSLSHFH